MSTKSEGEKLNIFTRLTRYLRDIRGELKKVVWPTKKQIINNTAIVIAAMIASSILIGALDGLLSTVVTLLFGA